MQHDRPRPRPQMHETLPAASALSPWVIALLVVAALMVALGFSRLPGNQLAIGVVAMGVFLAIAARICQARDQHLAVCRLLEARHEQR